MATAKTTRTTPKQRRQRLDALTAEADKCLAELRGEKRPAKARRRVLQERIAALGTEMRKLI